jgi:hypothetical protein
MDVEMIHRLAPLAFAVHHKAGPLFTAAQFHGQFPGPEKQSAHEGNVIFQGIHDAGDMPFGNEKKMNRSLRRDVVESQHLVVFVDLPAGNFSGDYFAEYTFAHDSQCTPDWGNWKGAQNTLPGGFPEMPHPPAQGDVAALQIPGNLDIRVFLLLRQTATLTLNSRV